MKLQLSEEAFCALAKKEIPEIAPQHDIRLESIQKAMKFTKNYSKQKQKLRSFIRSLEKKDILSARSGFDSVTTSPEHIRAMTKNKTEVQKLVSRNEAKLSLKRLRHFKESLEKEDMIRAKKKRKDTKIRKLVSRNKKILKRNRNSLRNDSKEHVLKSKGSKKRRHTTLISFQYRRQGTVNHTRPDTLDSDYHITLPAGFTMPPKYTLADRVTPVLFHHCNVTRDTCITSYKTGIMCARTMYYNYHTFDHLCVMDYVNCLDGFNFWSAIHPGPCIKIDPYSEYMHYPYQDDYFIDRDFIIEDIF